MDRAENLINKIFGKLKVISRSKNRTAKNGRTFVVWKCICSCGNIANVRAMDLKANKTKSCGCYRREAPKIHRLLPNNQAHINETWYKYKIKCKQKSLPFNLSKSKFFKLVKSACYYCGRIPSIRNGVDRKDNNKGYIRGNCLPCCKICNRAKSSMPYEDFIDWIVDIRNHNLW